MKAKAEQAASTVVDADAAGAGPKLPGTFDRRSIASSDPV
jgi:hypothetical protein